MVTISKPLQAAQVIDYHKQEYTNAQSNYYSQADQVPGQWHGKLAQELGLEGPVNTEHFTRLALGQNPHTGEQLVRHRIATANSAEHRAGWDATFSPPKSVSITALVGGDKAILEAHRLAVKEAIDYLERYANARMGGNNPSEQTGKWVAATFEHDAARPVEGFAAPQLHTHVVFFNIAQTEDGNFHALEPLPLFRRQNFATTIYQSRLARELYRLGYDLEQGKNHSTEIKGYTPEYLQANSDRSATINERMLELEKQGIHGPEARQILAHSTRESKDTAHTPEVMRQLHQDLAVQYGNQHQPVLKAALAQRAARQQALTPEAALTAAQQAVRYASDRGFEREALVSKSILERDAMRRAIGHATHQEIEAAFNARVQTGALIAAAHKKREAPTRGKQEATKAIHARTEQEPYYTTPQMLALEKNNIEQVLDGQGKLPPTIARGQIREDKLEYLRAQQHTAAIEILTSPDRVLGLQGAAGTGKTTTLRVIREELEHHGYRVQGYAPTSRAAHNLADAGIETTTLQYRLAHGHDTDPTPTVHFLDESSLASSKQMNEFLATLPATDRAVLVGDVRQHESIDAGRVFAQLQENGMHTSLISQIQRQKDPDLKQIVQLLSEGRAAEAFRDIQAQGRITEIKDPEQRYQAITKDYLADPENSLVLTTDNQSRTGLNSSIHNAFRESGRLAGDDREVPILETRQSITEADKLWAGAYRPSDTIRFSVGSKKLGIAPREYLRVAKVDAQANTLTVLKDNGTSITYDPSRNHGVTVFKDKEVHLAVGDRLQFTQPFKEHGIANRDLGTITSIGSSKDPSLTVKLDSGPQVKFNPAEFRHIDYGYTVTSYSSQSLTTKNVLSNLDTAVNEHLINDRMAYVMESRAEWVAKIYTNDIGRLESRFSRDESKTSAIQGVNELNQPPSISQSATPQGPMNTQERGNTLQPGKHETPVISDAITPGSQTPTPTKATEPNLEPRPIAPIDTSAQLRQPTRRSTRSVDVKNPEQQAGYGPESGASAPRIEPATSLTPEGLTGAQARFLERLERLQPADVQHFLQMSHEQRDTHMEHTQAFARMSPEQAAEFSKLSMPERSEYLLQHPALTQPTHGHSANVSQDRSIDRGGFSY